MKIIPLEQKPAVVRWLSKKLCWANLGFYATVALVMGLPPIIAGFTPVTSLISFCIFFAVAFVRAAFESMVLYEAPIKSLSLDKMGKLSAATSAIIVLLGKFLKSKLGYFSIPVSLIISIFATKRIKAALWPTTERSGNFALLDKKLNLLAIGRYIFYGLLVGLTILGYGKFGYLFYAVFGAAFFVGMVCEELYNLVVIYEQRITANIVVRMLAWSACCGIACALIVMGIMQGFGYGGQPATIIAVIVLKLIQPLGSRRFTLISSDE